MQKKKIKFIDLFAGIGGFHQAMHDVGGKCVFASEINKFARASYEANYKNISPNIFDNDYKLFNCDINEVEMENIPDFDVCCGGFPCQAFSIAGNRLGFEDTRGTLFFNIMNIVKYKIENGTPPKILFLENVKGLRNHHKGETLKVILATLDELGYNCNYEVLNAKYFGLPQNRERLIIVAWNRSLIDVNSFIFPLGIDKTGKLIFNKERLEEQAIKTKVSDIFEPEESIDAYYTISDRMWAGHQLRKERNRQNGKGFGYSLFNKDSIYCSTISARYWKDGSEILIDQSEKGLNPRRLTPTEAGRLQGFNIEGNGWKTQQNKIIAQQQKYEIAVSRKEAYQQFGNSVAVPVIKSIAREIVNQLL
ncbi:MAG: DNA (cytosine-5-)-methyltransferase [Phocaeicola sp.]